LTSRTKVYVITYSTPVNKYNEPQSAREGILSRLLTPESKAHFFSKGRVPIFHAHRVF
jgi:hypothetical protein